MGWTSDSRYPAALDCFLYNATLLSQYIEFVLARFRLMNLAHCGSPWADISGQHSSDSSDQMSLTTVLTESWTGKCNPRCVRLSKADKKDNQVRFPSVSHLLYYFYEISM